MTNERPTIEFENSLSLVRPVVAIVDDDAAVSSVLVRAIESLALDVECFASGEQFLARHESLADRPGCTLLDLCLQDEDGGRILEQVAADERHSHRPSIVISGYANVGRAVQVMQSGAWTLLQKPFQLEDVSSVVVAACAWSQGELPRLRSLRESRERWNQLTTQEREVVRLCLEGLPAKTIAARIGLSIRTVEARKTSVFRKLLVASVAEVARIASIAEREENSRSASARSAASLIRQDGAHEAALLQPLPRELLSHHFQ